MSQVPDGQTWDYSTTFNAWNSTPDQLTGYLIDENGEMAVSLNRYRRALWPFGVGAVYKSIMFLSLILYLVGGVDVFVTDFEFLSQGFIDHHRYLSGCFIEWLACAGLMVG